MIPSTAVLQDIWLLTPVTMAHHMLSSTNHAWLHEAQKLHALLKLDCQTLQGYHESSAALGQSKRATTA